MAISMIMRDSNRHVVQQHFEVLRNEAVVSASKLALAESELLARAEEVSQLRAEVAQQREQNAEMPQVAKQQQASQTDTELPSFESYRAKHLISKNLLFVRKRCCSCGGIWHSSKKKEIFCFMRLLSCRGTGSSCGPRLRKIWQSIKRKLR